ncbi:MAG: hypothetical protein Q4A78_01330 [Peptostreptococcaceae bacterium]|nr:hypothetical protein [Peptostreptococcaceae bacterium]
MVFVISNYILSVVTFFVALFQSWQLKKFIFSLLMHLLLWNLALAFLYILQKSAKLKKEVSGFEMQVEISEDEARDLLKEAEDLSERDEGSEGVM